MLEMVVEAVVLEGEHVRVEPLSEAHAAGLWEIGQVAEDWTYMPRGVFSGKEDCREWIRESVAISGQLPFALIDRATGRPAGSSRYLSIRPEHRGLEIGWTWLGREWQRTAINTEAKLLLLGHAFETLGAMRVEFKTDGRNVRSQAALERIGAVREGVFRRHMIVQGGVVRDSVYFSITDSDWPEVRRKLEQKLGR
jgi:RimJ/RimL family protein N-acetyltransferase